LREESIYALLGGFLSLINGSATVTVTLAIDLATVRYVGYV
jgi:hypothetical protein